MQRLQIKPTVRSTFQQQPLKIRITALGLAFILLVSTALGFIDAFRTAMAATPAYRQTSQIGSPQTLLAPYYFTTDDQNNFYVADGDNYVIRKFSPTGDLLLKFGPGDWSDVVGEFGWVSGIDVKSNGEIYVSDGDNYRINVYSPTGTYLRTFGSQGSVNPGEFDYNGHVRFAPNGNLYVADGSRIHVFDSNDTPIGQFGTAGSGPGQLGYIEDIAFDTNGDIYMADNNNGRITVFDSSWNYLRTIGQYAAYPAANAGDLYSPGGVAVTSDGYVLVTSTNTVKWFDKNTGAYVKRLGLADASESFAPGIPSGAQDIIVSADGNIHTIEPYISRVQSFTSDGTYIRQFGDYGTEPGQFWGPLSVDVDQSDNVYIVDSVNHRIQKYDDNRNLLFTFGSEGTGNGQFRRPRDVAVSPFNGNVYVTEWTSGPQSARVQIFDQSGNYLGQFGSQGQGDGQFASTTTLAISPINGNVYVNDDGHNGGGRIEVFSPTGTFLRNWNPILPISDYSGATGITFDSAGNSYMTAAGSGYIFKFNPSEQLIATLGQRAARDAGDEGYGGYGEIRVASNGMIYVARTSDHYIHILDSQGKRVAKIGSAGDGPNQFEWAQDLAIDSQNRLYVADDGNSRVSIYTVDASITGPSAPRNVVAAKSNNQINLNWTAPASSGNGTIREYHIETLMLDTHAQWESHTVVPASQTSLTLSNLPADRYQIRVTARNEAGDGAPSAVSGAVQLASPLRYEGVHELPPGQGYVAGFGLYSDGSFTIPSRDLSTRFQYDTAGVFTARLGSHGTGASQARFFGGADTDAADNLYVADRSNNRINKYAKDGSVIGNYTGVTAPVGLSVDRTNGHYYVITGTAIRKYTLAGVFVSVFAPAVTAPRAIDVTPDGTIYVAHQTGGVAEVARYNTAGTKLSAFPISAVYGNSVGSVGVFTNGDVITSDAQGSTVSVYASDGTLKGTLGYSTTPSPFDGGDHFNRFNSPENITVINDIAYVPDSRNGRVNMYSLAPAATQTPPSTPQSVAGDTSVANQMQITWVAPADDGGSPVTEYTLEYKLTSDSNWIPVTVTSPTTNHTLTGLAADDYDVRISATNSTGISDSSTPLTLTVNGPGAPITAPSAPQSVSVNDTAPGTLTINWQAPATDGGSAVTAYTLEYKKSDSPSWTDVTISAPTTTHTLSNLPAGTYEVRLSATNSIGNSPTTTPTSATVSSPVVPPSPSPTTPPPTGTVVTPQPSGAASSANTTGNTPSPTPAAPADESTGESTQQPSSEQSVDAVEQTDPGEVLITWRPPETGDPSSYAIEYRDASIPESNTTTPWQQVATVPGGRQSATISLPAGDFVVRVAAIFPGEATSRIILGVARISIPERPAVTPAQQPATIAPASSWPLWASICIALLTLAAFILIPIFIWKRKRKQEQARLRQTNLPPRWQNPNL